MFFVSFEGSGETILDCFFFRGCRFSKVGEVGLIALTAPVDLPGGWIFFHTDAQYLLY